jgi:hypothetical protein
MHCGAISPMNIFVYVLHQIFCIHAKEYLMIVVDMDVNDCVILCEGILTSSYAAENSSQ